jgi:hypothetical protein
MERIHPPTIPIWTLKNGKINKMDSLSEIGIFSCIFMDSSLKNKGEESSDWIIKNESLGVLMRTKGSHFNEGGVTAGYAVIDYPFLYDH